MIRYYDLRGVDVHIERLGFRPPMSYIEFPAPIPSVEHLSKQESRLIAPRLAFGKIMECMYKQHTKLNGAVVNVPAYLNKIQKMLPRLPLDGQTISLQLWRHLGTTDKRPSFVGNVHPLRVIKALVAISTTVCRGWHCS